MAHRTIAWVKDEDRGLEFAEVDLGAGRLRATGVAIGIAPEPYRLDYALATGDEFVTTELQVSARGEGWLRSLRLVRDENGSWTANGSREGRLSEALDCDLAWSPLTNTMPVLRHGLLEGGGPLDFVMAWVSVPDLGVHRSGQRYTFVRREGDNSIVRYESSSRDFVAELTFDPDGLVIAYPGIGSRIG